MLFNAGGNEVVVLSAVLYSCSMLLMIATVIAVVLLFLYYAQPAECHINRLFLGINSLLCLFMCVVSVLPRITGSQLLPASVSFHSVYVSVVHSSFVNDGLTLHWIWHSKHWVLGWMQTFLVLSQSPLPSSTRVWLVVIPSHGMQPTLIWFAQAQLYKLLTGQRILLTPDLLYTTVV